jgi:hypothetical protein
MFIINPFVFGSGGGGGGGGGGPVYAVWDVGTLANVTLSGGNLIASNTGTTSTNQGAHVASSSGKTSGKYYFEITTTAKGSGGNYGLGIGTTAATYTNMGNSALGGDMHYSSGSIWVNGGSSGSMGARSNGDVIGVAVDLGNRTMWFKKVSGTPSAWNATSGGSADPATNVGGKTVPAGTMVPFVTFGGSGGVGGEVLTANFGGTSFVGSVPSGFTSGWLV